MQGGWGSVPKPTTSGFGPPGKATGFKPSYTKQSDAQKAKAKEIQVLQPGLVHLPQIMDIETQVISNNILFTITQNKHTHKHKKTPTQTHKHTNTNTHTHTNTHKHTNTQTHKHTNTQTHKHTQTHTNTQTHKHTQTHTNTNKHTQTQTNINKHTAKKKQQSNNYIAMDI